MQCVFKQIEITIYAQHNSTVFLAPHARTIYTMYFCVQMIKSLLYEYALSTLQIRNNRA